MKTIQDDIDQELLPLFIEEADELCPQIGEILQAWREQPANAQLGRKLHRSLHTLKGSARMAGAMQVGELVHRMEAQVTGTKRPASFWTELQDQFGRIGKTIALLRTHAASETPVATEEENTAQRVPFASIGKRLYRIVRQTGKELGKKANLELLGTEVELQHCLLEKMTAPFEHLLRNAIAHGLESPQQREAAGKPSIGDIRLSLHLENNEAVFEFMDDGAGLDIEELRRKAVEKGLLKGDAVVSDGQVMQLIFAPGLSTATELTAISGHGVGMDVVRSEIALLGGRIAVSSEPGEGVRFIIRLPLIHTGNRAAGPEGRNCEDRPQGLQ